MSDINQVKDDIKKEIEKIRPSRYQILSYLSKLTFKEIEYGKEYKNKYIFLSSTEFYDIIGEIFKLNPRFFMNSLHTKIGREMRKRYGDEKRKEMDKYIIEKFCLYDGEQILYTCEAKVQQKRKGKGFWIYGTLFVTNNRIIVQGEIKIFGHTISNMRKIKNNVVERSVKQELPCYGHQFPYQNLFNLTRKRRKVTYKITLNGLPHDFLIFFYEHKEQLDNLIEILSNISEDARVGV